MFQKRKQISISTNGKDLYDITAIVDDFVKKSHIKDGLLKKEELAFEGWQDRAKEAMRKVAGKKPPKKHDYGRDAGKVARELMRKKDHQTVNFLDPDD